MLINNLHGFSNYRKSIDFISENMKCGSFKNLQP